jgi:hypothetical protein
MKQLPFIKKGSFINEVLTQDAHMPIDAYYQILLLFGGINHTLIIFL